MSDADYTIIASCINKIRYIERYGRLAGDVYEIALSFVIERAIFCLDAKKTTTDKTLKIFIEKRGKREDTQLATHFQKGANVMA